MSATSVETSTKTTQARVWPRYPTLYEINTWVWLAELSRRHGRRIDLSSVPATEWDAIAAFGFDGVWLMGIWERSPMGIAIANRNPALLQDFRRALPDFHPDDNVGSPYCVRQYTADGHVGGPSGLAVARGALAQRGLNLILDFVPNHVAPDHPWVTEHPEYFIQGSAEDARNDPASHLQLQGKVFACGKDPYFPAWPDVLQLNAFAPGLRKAVIKTLGNIAAQCDGVRCDMAMLFLNAIFERTWGARAGAPPANEYWNEIISATKATNPNFLFLAEAYWDLEWELQQKGFDFCYDKKLYDRLEHGDVESIRLHLCADSAYQNRLLRFIENHDEPRAAAVFPPEKERASALIMATVPGVKLFHEGQFEGRRVRLPVFLGRRPDEQVDTMLQEFYRSLLETIDRSVFREGSWRLCGRSGWPDNSSFENLLAWLWQKGDVRFFVAINFSDRPVQALVQLPWPEASGRTVLMSEMFSGTEYERDGGEFSSPGLYVGLGPWGYQLFQCVCK